MFTQSFMIHRKLSVLYFSHWEWFQTGWCLHYYSISFKNILLGKYLGLDIKVLTDVDDVNSVDIVRAIEINIGFI